MRVIIPQTPEQANVFKQAAEQLSAECDLPFCQTTWKDASDDPGALMMFLSDGDEVELIGTGRVEFYRDSGHLHLAVGPQWQAEYSDPIMTALIEYVFFTKGRKEAFILATHGNLVAKGAALKWKFKKSNDMARGTYWKLRRVDYIRRMRKGVAA